MYTDIHTHAFHPKIARKAVEHLNTAYHVVCAGTGTVEDLRMRERRAGMGRCVVLCAATTAAQVIPANNYAISLQQKYPGEIFAFGTMHPDFQHWEKELARLKAAGIKGIKLHPDFQHFRLDDRRLFPFFEAAQKDFLFQIHIGDTLPPAENPSCPYKAAALLDRFPRMRLIAAHLGGYMQWEHALKALAGRDVWLETSSSMPFISDALLHALLQRHPHDRLLFGSDYPLYDPGEACALWQRRSGCSDSDLEDMMENAGRLLDS